jgi:hypothetical protein
MARPGRGKPQASAGPWVTCSVAVRMLPPPLAGCVGLVPGEPGRPAVVAAGSVVVHRPPVRPRPCVVACRRSHWCRGRVYGGRRGGPSFGHGPRRRVPRCAGGGFAPDVRRGHPSPSGDSFGRPFVPRLGIARPRPVIRRRRVCCGACPVAAPGFPGAGRPGSPLPAGAAVGRGFSRPRPRSPVGLLRPGRLVNVRSIGPVLPGTP